MKHLLKLWARGLVLFLILMIGLAIGYSSSNEAKMSAQITYLEKVNARNGEAILNWTKAFVEVCKDFEATQDKLSFYEIIDKKTCVDVSKLPPIEYPYIDPKYLPLL